MPVATDGSAGLFPPNDYRGISIPPTAADLQAGARPFLRPIVTHGPYDNVAHYLDVNFRLLREDLIQPIRCGLQQFRNVQHLGGGLTSGRELSFGVDNGTHTGKELTAAKPIRLLTKSCLAESLACYNAADSDPSCEGRIPNGALPIQNGCHIVEDGVSSVMDGFSTANGDILSITNGFLIGKDSPHLTKFGLRQTILPRAENVVHLNENVVHPVENGIHSVENGIHSVENGIHSVENGIHLIENGIHSVENGIHSVENGIHSVENGTHPVENGTLPVGNGTHPVGNGTHPVGNGTRLRLMEDNIRPIVHAVDNGLISAPIPSTHELAATDSCSIISGSVNSDATSAPTTQDVVQDVVIDSTDTRVRKEQHLNVYRGVRLVHIFGVQGFGVVHRVAFNERFSRLPSRVDWDATKRLLTGSLVLLSTDNFRSFVLAVVVMRRSHELSRGVVTLKLLGDAGDGLEHADLDGRATYVMAESPSYFEAYRYFLQGLQRLDHNRLPFSKYLVDLVRDVDPPRYLTSKSECNLDCFRQGPLSPEAKPLRCQFLDPNSWPDAVSLHLDDAQYRALCTALTKELALIQGPPGTGKTYLGLKIVNVLLDSQPSHNRPLPILVLCHTNHALDQFLEGTLNFCPEGVVRVGGRSKSEHLERFTLSAIKQRLRQTRGVPVRFHRPKKRLVDDMRRCAQRMNQWRRMLDESRRRVMDAAELRKLMGSRYLEQFMRNTALYSSLDEMQGLTEWLGLIDFSGDSRPTSRQEWAREAPRPRTPKPTFQVGGWNVAVADVLAREEMERRLEDDYSVDESVYDHMPPRRPVDKVTAVHKRNVFAAAEEEAFDTTGIIFEDYEFPGRPTIAMMGLGDTLPPSAAPDDEMQQRRNIANLLRDRRAFSREEAERVGDVWQLSLENRWRLYRHWLSQFQSTCQMEIDNAQRQYEQLNQSYVDLDDQLNIELLRGARIIGMTTTGAAKFQRLLQIVAPQVVVIEEAAEVLEANLLATLHPDCQHLILIGDQQQLRPHTAVHRLNLKYHFDVSLFERLIANEVHYERLLLQYRMRPDISTLLVPHIYPALADHESVCCYGDVHGMASNIFFMSHQLGESGVADSATKYNQFEAEYLVRLGHYLIQQGHPPSSITILTTYIGQLFAIKRILIGYPALRDVVCTVVDNYQGKENEIVLLSLVRSNSRGTVGFIQSDNRTCVALSRAKRGLYCVGNFDLLKANAVIWRCVVGLLEASGQIGTAMALRCVNHPDTVSEVSSLADFEDKVPEGGCNLPCQTVLPCGHPCPLWCHSYDRDHITVRCQEPCKNLCSFGHPCPRLCSDSCGPCPARVDRLLPCEHVKQVACYQNANTKCQSGCRCFMCFCDTEVPITTCLKGHYQLVGCYESEGREFKPKKCAEPCIERLPCGHPCPGTCAEPCELFQCPQLMAVTCRRGHSLMVPCHRIEDDVWIQNSCQLAVTLACGHKRSLPCLESGDSEDVDDVSQSNVRQPHVCDVGVVGRCDFDHQVFDVPCSQATDQQVVARLCREPCLRGLSCGHACVAPCGGVCTTASECRVVVVVKSPCGHDTFTACGQRDTLSAATNDCRAPCNAMLPCGHTCSGTCADCHQGRMHVLCKERSERVMVCGHTIVVRCGRAPEPCLAECGTQCYHRRCRRRCCVACEDPCRQPCHWYCRHYRCTRLCGELCDRPPCDHPCRRLLPCGHPCTGYCGEPCPRLCRVCNADELCAVFFGNENRPDARFVLLENCSHVIESSMLDSWMGLEEPQAWWPHELSRLVRVKGCPRCGVPIRQNLRYGNYIKAALADVAEVKRRIFAEFIALQNSVRHRSLHREIRQTLQCRPPRGALAYSFNQLERELHRQRFRLYEINLIKNKMTFLRRMAELLARIEEASDPDFVRERLLALESWLIKFDGRQEHYGENAIFEFARELVRILYLYQLEFKTPKSAWDSPLYSKVYEKVTGLLPFSLAVERVVIVGLRQLQAAGRSVSSCDASGSVTTAEEYDIKKTLVLNSGLWFCSEGRYYHCSGNSSYERI